MPLPLAGRTAVVTGVSRRRGIGFAVASRLASMGASLAVQHHVPHDSEQYGAAEDLADLLADLRDSLTADGRLVDVAADLGEPWSPEDPARLIGWLVSDEGRWVVGQVLNSEGGFRRSS